MKYGSVCSGIEAATDAWEPLGWEPQWFAEIEKFPSGVLAHHYPEVKNHGDFTKIGESAGPVRLLVGGTPCQSFSVAGKRAGLDDPRGNLTLEFVRLARRLRPSWLVWENVPGVLSIDEGRTFGEFLGALEECGYGWAYRVLDAQYWGVPQRRRRVFVVGYLGDFRPPAAVLFERESMSGNPAPRRSSGKVAPSLPASGAGTSRTRNERTEADMIVADTAPTLNTTWADRSPGSTAQEWDSEKGGRFVAQTYQFRSFGQDPVVAGTVSSKWAKGTGGPSGDECQNLITHPLTASPFVTEDRTGRGTPIIPINTQIATRHEALGEGTGMGVGEDGDPAYTLQAGHEHAVAFAPTLRASNGGVMPAVAFNNRQNPVNAEEVTEPIGANDNGGGVMENMTVRRLTPVECSRLQGFPDDYLEIKYADAEEAHTTQILHELWKETGKIAREGWRSAIVTSLLTPEVLLAGVYGGWVSWEVAKKCSASRGSLPSANAWAEGFVRALQFNEEHRSSPYRQESFEQCARELGRPLPELPLKRTQAREVLRNSELWPEAQRAWPLRYAFATEKERSSSRSLNPDGPRYRALGNSMAVPVMRWIGERIQMAEELLS
jgi:DNA (cytosine-5)-methyltransferase 1